MASYTNAQLLGSGSLNESLTGAKTFTFTNNSSGSAYFTFELNRNANGFYSSSMQTLNNATFTSLTNVSGILTSSYICSAILGQGASSFIMTPGSNIPASSGRFRGTGQITLVVT